MKLKNLNYAAIIQNEDGTIVALAHGNDGFGYEMEETDKLRWLHPDYHDRVCEDVRNLSKHEKYSGYQPEPVKPELPPRPKVGEIVHITKYGWSGAEGQSCAMDCKVTGSDEFSFTFSVLRGLQPAVMLAPVISFCLVKEGIDAYTIGAKCEPPQPELPAWVKPGAIWSHGGKGGHDGRTYYRLDKCEGDMFYSTDMGTGYSRKPTGRPCFEVGRKGGLAAVQWQPKPDERVRLIDGAVTWLGLEVVAHDAARVMCGPYSDGHYCINLYKDEKHHGLLYAKLDQLMPYVEAA